LGDGKAAVVLTLLIVAMVGYLTVRRVEMPEAQPVASARPSPDLR
jgi:hypothetical protein